MVGDSLQTGSLLRRWRTDRAAIVSLVVLAIVLKLIVLLQHPILARDGIRHLHFAYDLAEKPWASTVREHPFHPGYAYTVLVASMIFDWCDPGPLTPSEWQWCGHLSSSLAGVLLILPLYGLARCFFSIRTVWLASLFFLMLPSVVQTTSDTLTESWYLLFALGSLWAMVHGVRSQRSSWFVLAGLLAGAGYLVRVEALILPASYVLWMFLRRVQSGEWLPRGCCVRNLGILGVCFVLPALPYMVTIGKLSNRPAVQTIAESSANPVARSGDRPQRLERPQQPLLEPVHLLATQRLQDGVNGLHIDKVHFWDATHLVAITHLRAGQYVLWPLAAVGCYLMWRTLRRDAGYLLLVGLLLLHTAMLMRLALTAGYTSERHTLLTIVLVAQAAAVGFVGLKQWLKQHWHGHRRVVQGVGTVVMLGMIAVCLPKAVQPLHESQEGHRQAGLWLAENLNRSGGDLVDPYTWASFYAGVAFKPPVPRNEELATLGVVDPRDNDLNRLRDWKQAGLLSEGATTEWVWPSPKQPKLLIKRKAHQGLGKPFTF